jgi:peptidoglycan/LPS O-acetylase OafA/YrhL
MRHFRSDIEGLRAVAVILVILYHYQFPGITGGFIGVDVFFVISGFVITQLLTRSMQEQSFRFRDFYARRIRRLVPVFLLVSTATFLMISPFYLDDDYYIFAKSWLASLVGLSNHYYFSELSQYFAPEAQSLSLLHTWSLAVEEQFYLLWPAILYLAFRYGRGRDALWPFVLLWLAAFALSVSLTYTHKAAAYYLLPARVFELMLGAGLALFAARLPAFNRQVAQALSLSGLMLIVATALLIDSSSHFPGYNALWPTLGAGMILLAGLQHTNTWVAQLLSTRILVFLGAISYSLYLWHWPPVALLHYQLIELTWLNRILLIAATGLLSWLSYRFVENRYRYRPWPLKKSVLLLVFVPALLIWVIQSTIRIADDISFRISAERRELYQIISQHNAADLYVECFKGETYTFDQSPACLFGSPAPNGIPDSVLIGDSHAIALIGFMEQLLAETDHSMLMVTRASTPFVRADQADAAFAGDQEKIDRSEALDAYLRQRPMTVFVSAWWNAYLENPAFEGYFLDAIHWLLEQQHEVFMLEDVPELPSAAYAHCLLRNMDDCSIDAAAVNIRLQNFLRFKQLAQERFPQVQWIDPAAVLCDEERCQTVMDGIPLYRDESHLNNIGSIAIGKRYLERFDNPLLPN